jgi:hypothetical protein
VLNEGESSGHVDNCRGHRSSGAHTQRDLFPSYRGFLSRLGPCIGLARAEGVWARIAPLTYLSLAMDAF